MPDDGVADSPAHDDAHPGGGVPTDRVPTDRRRVHDESSAGRTSPAYCGPELVRAAHSIDLGKHTTSVVRRRDECGPCGAVRRGSPCRRACASAAGTRASCCDGGCSVETYAYSRGLAPIFTVDRHGGRMVLGRVAACCTAASAAAPNRVARLACTRDQRRRPADFPTVRGGSTGVKPARGCLYTGPEPGEKRHAARTRRGAKFIAPRLWRTSCPAPAVVVSVRGRARSSFPPVATAPRARSVSIVHSLWTTMWMRLTGGRRPEGE